MTVHILDKKPERLVQAVENVARSVAQRYITDQAVALKPPTPEAAGQFFKGAATLAVMEGHMTLAEALRQVGDYVEHASDTFGALKQVVYGN